MKRKIIGITLALVGIGLCIHIGITQGAGPTPLGTILGGTGISTSTAGNNNYNLYQVGINSNGSPIYGFQANGSGGGAISINNISTSTFSLTAGSGMQITSSTGANGLGIITFANTGAGSSTVAGTGQANYFALWSGASTLVTSTLTISGTSINSSGTIAVNGALVLTTSTGLVVANFSSPNISQWTNNSGYLTTSTGLVIANFASANISQWTNNSNYTTSTAITAGTCTNCNLTYNGSGLITVAGNGSGGSGSVSTSSAITTNNFPFWTSVGGALSGTSTLTVSGANLFAGGTFNASGTITQNGVAVLTTSTGLSTANFSSANISQWTNNSSYVTSTGANPSASVGLTAVNGTANTFLRSDGAPSLSQSIIPVWTGKHVWDGLPLQQATSSILQFGSNFITGGNVSGTYLGANPTSTFNGDFINFQVGSTTKFRVSGAGNIDFTNATGTGNVQSATLNVTGQSTLANTTSSNLEATGTMKVAGTSLFVGNVSVGSTTASSIPLTVFGNTTSSILIAGSSSAPFSPGCWGTVVSSTLTVWTSYEVSSTIQIHQTTSSSSGSPNCYFQFPNP